MIKNTYIKLSDDKNVTLAVFSDIHYCKNYPQKRLDTIYKSLQKHHPDYICIVGDLLDQGDVLEDATCKETFITWLQELSKIAPVVIAIGNHDVTVKHPKQHYRFPREIMEAFTNIPNIYVLDNQSITMNSICFFGYTPSYAYYHQKPFECAKMYIEDIDQRLKSFVKKECYSILLCHSPIYVTDSEVRKTDTLRSMDLVLSGHMHNGILPFRIPGNYGLISPSKKLFPRYARGHFTLENTTYIVSGGVITFSDVSPRIFHPLNTVYPIHIEYVRL